MYPCERHSTLSALCGCAMCASCPRVCVYTIHMCVKTCLSKDGGCLYQYRWTENRWTGGERVNRSRLRSRNKTPADKPNTEGLSQVYYICQQWSFIATGHRSHSFPVNAASSGTCRVCETDPQPLANPLSARLSQVVLDAVTSYPHEPADPLIHYHVSYHHHRRGSASLKERR